MSTWMVSMTQLCLVLRKTQKMLGSGTPWGLSQGRVRGSPFTTSTTFGS